MNIIKIKEAPKNNYRTLYVNFIELGYVDLDHNKIYYNFETNEIRELIKEDPFCLTDEIELYLNDLFDTEDNYHAEWYMNNHESPYEVVEYITDHAKNIERYRS